MVWTRLQSKNFTHYVGHEMWDQLEKRLSVHSNFVILIPKKSSLAHRASDGQNPLAPGYQTWLSLQAAPVKLNLVPPQSNI